jgi:signal transduction histidine kinase
MAACLLGFICFSNLLLAGNDSLFKAIRQAQTTSLNLADRQRLCIAALNVIDDFMSRDLYDSSQIWLNETEQLYADKNPSLLNYYFTSRHAEIYYYNQLFQLGLKEVDKGMNVARKLGDSILLEDAYNLMGLLYLNLDSLTKAKQCFHTGLLFAKPPPYPPAYLPISNPYHLLSNMAEACERLGQWDSSYSYNRQSLAKAEAINAWRGMAVAHNNLGNLFLKDGLVDSANARFQLSLNIALRSRDFDVELVNYLGLAECALQAGDKPTSKAFMKKGMDLMEDKPEVNALFSRNFLKRSVSTFKALDDPHGVLMAYEKLVTLDSVRERSNTDQFQHILQANISNENNLLKMQIVEAEQQQALGTLRWYISIAAILLLLISLLAYRYYFTRKIRMAALRDHISRDLHDDVGATLSSLHIYGSIAEKTMDKDPQQAKNVLRHITNSTKQLVENMSDMVWAIDNGIAAESSFGYRLKNFGYDLLNSSNIACNYAIDPGVDEQLAHPDSRKNLLLIVKEAINNIAKYSSATEASIHLYPEGQRLILRIADNGIGFEPDKIKKGHGLANMQNRTAHLKGTFSIESAPDKGTTIACTFPITIIRDKM